jgi:hypothetical protein
MNKISRESAWKALEVFEEIVRAEGAEAVSDMIIEMLDEHEDDSAMCDLLQGFKDALRAVNDRTDGLTASITLRSSSTTQVHLAWDPGQPMTDDFHSLFSDLVARATQR